MAEISSDGGGSHKKVKGKPKGKKMSTHIDMTPMVDLAFLLLTFFMLATSFSRPHAMEVIYPEKPKNDKDIPELPKERALTFLVGKNDKLLYYYGLLDKSTQLENADYSPESIRKIVMDRMVYAKNYSKDHQGLFVMIKATEDARYKNIVDIFDEMNITKAPNYAIMDILPEEKKMLDAK
ncbi:MAG: biopolymer transporter ExbD [Bacteroidetes bacterium]|nr:biopolymer transporter ExbD [Bacteroidota bacterium]